MFSLSEPPLFTRLKDARKILIAGAGGGFDVYAGIPLALALRGVGKQVHLANLSFTNLTALDMDIWLQPGVAAITPETEGKHSYFPERVLASWLASEGLPSTVYAFPRVGVQPLRIAYRSLLSHLEIDAVVLVDGGTDILMRGDEVGLGTPEEDMTSLAALAGVDGVDRLVACIGFGIDTYHGVCHSHVLENLASLTRTGAYLGAFSIPPDSAEAAAYLRAVDHAQAATPRRPSIVNGQIAAAIRGEFGNSQFTERTAGSELFVNPLMAMYFTLDLPGLAESIGYLPRMEESIHMVEVAMAIREHREHIERRIWRAFPH
ncbi:DUF1152 domain-containing protein [Kibdelosporangium philippinense]|uniref:DUF1152 domain-containing protein n=1 Tax=Kibdelosporangium philippinense TaxID=211113 RepID=A0ABS8ZWD3_9PSEU|nr:DUF1152 domain-containing protein [Kibdelosporangium philippinense]MCE7012006.1 DUF1152 domain-containing protein [Kibdelosporangium philippinense]